MSDYQPIYEFEQSSSGESRTGLWVALIGVALCLIVAIILASLAGLGWIVYVEAQDDNATATIRAQKDNAAPVPQAHGDNTEAASQAQNVLPPPDWTVLINDPFALNPYGWSVGSRKGDYGDVAFSYQNQRYRMRVKANSREGMTWWTHSNFYHQLDDFYVSAECRLVSGDPAGTACGLAYRISSYGNYYYFVISEDQFMTVVLEKYDKRTNLLTWEHTELAQPDQMNQLAVLAEGEHYKFFINGELAYELDDDQLTRGQAGIIADVWGRKSAEFEFDNFQVCEPGR